MTKEDYIRAAERILDGMRRSSGGSLRVAAYQVQNVMGSLMDAIDDEWKGAEL